MLSIHVWRGLPLCRFASRLPSRRNFCNLWCLITWPKYFSVLVLITLSSCNDVDILFKTSALVTLSVQGIFIIFLYDHISNAVSLLIIVFEIVKFLTDTAELTKYNIAIYVAWCRASYLYSINFYSSAGKYSVLLIFALKFPFHFFLR